MRPLEAVRPVRPDFGRQLRRRALLDGRQAGVRAGSADRPRRLFLGDDPHQRVARSRLLPRQGRARRQGNRPGVREDPREVVRAGRRGRIRGEGVRVEPEVLSDCEFLPVESEVEGRRQVCLRSGICLWQLHRREAADRELPHGAVPEGLRVRALAARGVEAFGVRPRQGRRMVPEDRLLRAERGVGERREGRRDLRRQSLVPDSQEGAQARRERRRDLLQGVEPVLQVRRRLFSA